jgi:hypothetical protein
METNLSRKQRNMEIEKRVKTRRTTTLLIMACIAGVLAAVVAFMVWSNINAAHLMVWNGQRIPTSDLRYIHVRDIGDQISPESRAWAMESLQFSLAILDMAEENNIGLTAAQRTESLTVAQDIRNWLNDGGVGGWLRGVSNNRMAELNSAMEHLITPLVDTLVLEYDPDPELFEADFEMYYAQNWLAHADLQIKFAVSEDFDELNQGFVDWMLHQDFDRFVREHSTFYDEDEGIDVMDAALFMNLFNVDDWNRAVIMELQPGEASHIFHMGGVDAWVVVYMYQREEADAWAMRWEFWQEAVNSGRMEIFFDMVEERVESAEVELNQRAWERFQ